MQKCFMIEVVAGRIRYIIVVITINRCAFCQNSDLRDGLDEGN